jgi:hypothetical protein
VLKILGLPKRAMASSSAMTSAHWDVGHVCAPDLVRMAKQIWPCPLLWMWLARLRAARGRWRGICASGDGTCLRVCQLEFMESHDGKGTARLKFGVAKQ